MDIPWIGFMVIIVEGKIIMVGKEVNDKMIGDMFFV